MSDIQNIIDMASKADRADRADQGQKTLGYLSGILNLLDPTFPLEWDTGHQFGNEPVTWGRTEAFDHPDWPQPATDRAESATAHPSCYRGYYSDVTFNCSTTFERSTVGHVCAMVDATIGTTMQGYKGGAYPMTDGTLVWGGDASHSGTANARPLIGVTTSDGVVILLSGDPE